MQLFTGVVVLCVVVWMLVPSTALGNMQRRDERNEVGRCEELAPVSIEALVWQYCTDPHDYLPMLTYLRTQYRTILESLRWSG